MSDYGICEDHSISFEPEEEELKETDYDADAAYERYRDSAGDALAADLIAVLKAHNDKKGYYHGMPDRIRRHALAIIDAWRQ